MSPQKKKILLKWALYALFFLACLLVQDVLLGKYALQGVPFYLAPAAAATVACREGAEKGGLFCLLASLFWAWWGAGDGGLMVLLVTFGGCLCGYLCASVFHVRILPICVLSLGCLAMTLGVQYLIHIYLEGLGFASMGKFFFQLLLALPFCPLFHWVCRSIGKVGANG